MALTPLPHQGRFDVYHSSQGSQGKWEVASKSQLENELGSKDVEEAIKKVLKNGEDRTAKSVGKTKESAVKKWVLRCLSR